MADNARQRNVGGEVYLRGLIEFSNYCIRLCKYCGLRAANTGLTRYRMSEDEILQCARQAVSFGYGTVVLQSGEDPGVTADWIGGVIRRIKTETSLAVTLSLGERTDEDHLAWKKAGADRYLLRFETSNRALYDEIHPPRAGAHSDRIALLQRLRQIGYEVGSGVMIGIPGQSYHDLARDIELFGELNLDMIGVGPYLPHPDTPLGDPEFRPLVLDGAQVPNDELTTYKVIAPGSDGLPAGQYPQHNGVGDVEYPPRPGTGARARRQCGHAESHARQVPHPLRNLSQQGVHSRDGRHLPALRSRADRVDRTCDRDRPRRLAELLRTGKCPPRAEWALMAGWC